MLYDTNNGKTVEPTLRKVGTVVGGNELDEAVNSLNTDHYRPCYSLETICITLEKNCKKSK